MRSNLLNAKIYEIFGLAKQYMRGPILIDISHREDGAIQNALPEIAATEYIFKYIHAHDFTPHLVQTLLMLRQAPSDIKQIALKYLVYGARLQRETLIKAAHQYLPFDEDYVMNIATQCEEIGIQKGIQKGKLEEKKQIAMNMLKIGLKPLVVAQATQLEMPIVTALFEELADITET